MDAAFNQSVLLSPRITVNHIGLIIFTALVCILDLWILTANAFVLFSLSRGTRTRLNVTRKLLINLACADLGIGLFVIPWAIATEIFEWNLFSPLAACHWGLSLDIFFSTTSLYSLTVIAIDQFVGVCYALRYNQMFTGAKVTILISGPWIASLINAIPMIGFSQWHLVLRTVHIQAESEESSMICSIHDAGSLMRVYWCLLGFCPPLILVSFSHFRVCKRVIQNIRGLHSGVIQDKEELLRLKQPAGSNTSSTETPQEPKVSSMRVHIGGQPCYMRFNQSQSKKAGSEMFSHLPGTLKCGFLIMSTTIPAKPSEKMINSSDRLSPARGKSQAKNLSILALNKSRSGSGLLSGIGNDSRNEDFGLEKRNSMDNQCTSLLKPPKWLPSRSFSRKSDSEFASLRAMRRCALMPMQPRMQHSVSTEISTNPEIEIAPSNHSEQAPVLRSSENTVAVASFSDAPVNSTESRLKREIKAVCQFGINCAIVVCGWIPFIFVHLIHSWLPPDTIPKFVLHWFYWVRFFCTALNPIVCGSANEELRKAFRNLVYCGRPKQEKKALKRLVLAGLGAAGLSYGRPIIPVGIRKNPSKNSINT